MLTFGEIEFEILTIATQTDTQLKVTPKNLEVDNTPIVAAIKGKILDAEIADINGDNSPEIFIYNQTQETNSTISS